MIISYRRKPFLKLTTDGAIDHSGRNGCHLLGNGLRSSSGVYGVFKGCFYVVHGFVSCVLSALNRCLLTALRKLCSQKYIRVRIYAKVDEVVVVETATTAVVSVVVVVVAVVLVVLLVLAVIVILVV